MIESIKISVSSLPVQQMKNKKILLIISYTLGSSFITIFQRYLTFYFDSFTQNFYRYLAGSLSLLLISFLFYPEDLKEILKNMNLIGKIALLAGLVAVAQSFFIEGLAYTSAMVTGFISTLGLPLTIVLAVLIFPAEKEIARGKNFLLGFFLAFAGTIGFILGKGSISLEYSLGILFLIIGTAISVFITLLLKRLVIKLNPVCVSALLTFFMCFFFFISGLIWGDLSKIRHVSSFTNFILFASGVYGLIFGINLVFVNLKISGILVTKIAELTIPVFTALFAFIFLKESLNILQTFFGMVILIGSLIAVLISAKEKTIFGEYNETKD